MRRLRIALAFIFGLFLPTLDAAAQDGLPRPLASEGRASSAASTWRMLIDESGELSLAEVLEQRHLFQRVDKHAFTAPADDKAIWLHVNMPGYRAPHWLWIFAPRVQQLDYYLLQDGRVREHVRTGEQHSLSSRPLPARAYLFSLPNDAEPREAYIRMQSNHPLMVWFDVIDEAELVAQEKPAYLFGALLGALALLAIHCFLRFAYTFSAPYAWLGLAHAALLGCAAANLGMLAVWFPRLGYSQSLIADVSALLAALTLLGFAASFFRRWSLWMRVLFAAEIGAISVTMLSIVLFPSVWKSWLIYALVLMTTLTVPLLALHHWRRGYTPARLVIAGMLLFNGGFGFFLPVLFGADQLHPGWLVSGVFSVATVSGLILSFALVERQRHIRAETQSRFTAAAVNSAENRTKADFLARISHEIRTPMNGVLGMTELLLGTSLSAKQRDYVQTIHSSGNELLNLINEILDVSKLESGQIEIEDVQFDLHALLSECLDMFRTRAEQQHVELISLIQPQVPQVVSGDPTRLRQALVGLLESAFRQTENGEVLLSATFQSGRLTLRVQDNGEPLEIEERDTALESRDFLAASQLGGRLGLIIARQLVHLMHGELGVERPASEGVGNTLWLTLPLEGHYVLPSAADLDRPLRGARLLVVDDNETCRKVLLQQCAGWGMQVSTAPSGREALALMRTRAHLGEYFDVVLLDQDMPGMTGLQLAMKIKEDLNLPHDALLIMLTGMSSAPGKINARNAGIKRVLTKPVAGYTLKTTLAEELAGHTVGAPIGSTAPADTLRVPDGFRILVAEDNSVSTKVIRGMLKKLNLQADTASNGEEAIQAIKRHPYDLVLMDCEMPVMDGFLATERLRAWEAAEGRPRTPVVALTAHIMSEHKERARKAGMDGHMSKPVELNQLRELIEYWVAAKEALHPDA
ncbi:hybrid sensor histidine kinase/response regulator [Stutzerimonas urumqiensis]|uniref:hybrid sensor histidine kinase/response regulator n=1 Tax=Stutzerimonas urumqiensis TaxID=638269 RepID=UPI000EB5ABFF|nr:hybrid sensor histidine kinase/response regulator [Stutzerimonas urumqiensis]